MAYILDTSLVYLMAHEDERQHKESTKAEQIDGLTKDGFGFTVPEEEWAEMIGS